MPTRSVSLSRAMRASALGVALTALSVAATAAQAQFPTGRSSTADALEIYEWRGRVDSEIRLVLRGNRASVQRVGTNETRNGSGRLLRRLPDESGRIRVERLDGRGLVDVLQQPSAGNDYTAIVRLRDPSGGADYYRVAAYWQGNGPYSDRRTGSSGTARRRERDERDERDERRGRNERDRRVDRDDDDRDDDVEDDRDDDRDDIDRDDDDRDYDRARDRRDDDDRVESRSDREERKRDRKRDREERKRDRERDREERKRDRERDPNREL